MAGEPTSTEGRTLRLLKAVFALLCLILLASNIGMMLRWGEARGVYDDVCYLRQAHLFQRFGISGFDTSASRDDDGYFRDRLKEINFPDRADPTRWPCHNPMHDGKVVVQYPPGTGFLLALFPQGQQVVPLYVLANVIVCGFALFGIFSGRSVAPTLGAGSFGALAVLLMINPAKASYSIAPTMVICALAGYLTALWMAKPRNDAPLLAIVVGFVIGLSINFRLPNLILGAGYFLFLGISLLRSRRISTLLQSIGFGVAFVVGMLPTLIANAINAGSPLTTTYGNTDAVAPAFSLATIGEYAGDAQLLLLVLALGCVIWLLRTGEEGKRHVGFIIAGNLAVNLSFFLSHPIVTPYYLMPIAILSLWSACFAGLMQPAKTTEPTTVAIRGSCLEALPQ